MEAKFEREISEHTIRELQHPDDLRPDPSRLPSGEALADLFEDINRGHHGLPPLHGQQSCYYTKLGIFSRDNLIIREGRVFIPLSLVAEA